MMNRIQEKISKIREWKSVSGYTLKRHLVECNNILLNERKEHETALSLLRIELNKSNMELKSQNEKFMKLEKIAQELALFYFLNKED